MHPTRTLACALALPFVALASGGPAAAQEEVVPAGAAGLRLHGATLLWNIGCGDDFSPAQSHVRARPLGVPAGGWDRTLYRPAGCTDDRVASAAVATDGAEVLWLTADGRVLALPIDATEGAAPRLVAAGSPAAAGGWLAVDDAHVFWTEGTSILRAPRGGGAAGTVLTGSAALSDLRVAPGGGVFFLQGTRLRMITPLPAGDRYLPIHVADGATAFAIDGGRVYYAAGSGPYVLMSKTLDNSDLREHYRSTAPGERVDNVAVAGGTLYWHVGAGVRGPLYRLVPGGAPEALTSDLSTTPATLGTDGTYLAWADAGRVYRLALAARPVETARGNVEITGVEVTQGLQNPEGTVPLVGRKPTVVRVYVRATDDANGPWTGVGARLDVAGSPRVHGAGAIRVPTAGSDPARLTDSFTFLLDPDETNEGTRALTVTLLPPAGRAQSTTADDARTVSAAFGPARYLTIYGWTYANTNNGADPVSGGRCVDGGSAPDGVFRPFSNFEVHRRWAENVYPVSMLFLAQLPGSGTQSFDNRACGGYVDAHQALDRIVAMGYADRGIRAVSFQPEQLGYYGWCCTNPAGNFVLRVQDLQLDPGPTLAHEVGHSFGLAHTFEDANYPRTNSMVGTAADGPVGNVRGFRLQPTWMPVLGQTSDGAAAAWDHMSYRGTGFWTSVYSYCRLLRSISGGTTTCPSGLEGAVDPAPPGSGGRPGRGGGGGGSTMQDHGLDAALLSARRSWPVGPAGPALYVAGAVDPAGAVTLEPFEIVDGVPTDAGDGSGHTVRLEDPAGNVLGEYALALSGYDEPNDPVHGGDRRFGAFVPWDPAAARVVVLSQGAPVAERAASPSAPTVTMKTDLPAELQGRVRLAWEGVDPDGDALTYSVWYTPDGQRWTPIAALLRESSLEVDADDLPGGEAAAFRVVASDGMRTGEAATGAVRVARKAPRVTLDAGDAGMVVNAGQPALLSGRATDAEDGAVTDEQAYQWSEDGQAVGSGPWVVLDLAAGAHSLTLTVRDRDGLASSATVRVDVQAGE